MTTEKNPTNDKNSTTDQILDLLLEALLERQQARYDAENSDDQSALLATTPSTSSALLPELKSSELKNQALTSAPSEPTLVSQSSGSASKVQSEPHQWEVTALPTDPSPKIEAKPEPKATNEIVIQAIPQRLPSIQLERMLSRGAIALVILIIAINIPINQYGTSLSRAMPDEKSIIIRDGLVIKGDGDEIYRLENNQKRWITSLDAFEWYGHDWDQVNQVDDDFLADFANGPPIYLLLRCTDSPHIYALENGQKRWIKDIPTFEANNFVWEEIKITSCSHLRNLPDGIPLPEDAGPPPQP